MTKILMVCLGNICRSPLAEGLMRHHLIQSELHHITVDSAGTSGWHIGEKPDKRTRANAAQHRIDLDSLRARQFATDDFSKFDKIYVMDASNYRDVLTLASSAEDEAKVDLLLNAIYPNENRAVPDPYYGGEDGFEEVFQLVNAACERIAQQLKAAQHE